MFPNAKHMPAHLTQQFGAFLVPLLVCIQLLQPIPPIALWPVAVLRATVPEAPVNKDGQPMLAENEVGPARQLGVPPPPFDAVPPKCCHERQFGGPVA